MAFKFIAAIVLGMSLALAGAPTFAQTRAAYPNVDGSQSAAIIVNAPAVGIVSIQVTCSTSATTLPSYNFVTGFVISATSTNTGTIFIGGSNVNTTRGTGGTGFPIGPAETLSSISYAATNPVLGSFVCTNNTDTFTITGN